MPLASSYGMRRRASMMPRTAAQQQQLAEQGMVEKETSTPQLPRSVSSSSKSHRFGVSPYGAAAPLDGEGGMSKEERKRALLKKRQSLAALSRFSHTGGQGISYSGLPSSSSSSQDPRPEGGGQDENVPPPAAAAAAGAGRGGRGLLKPWQQKQQQEEQEAANVVSAAVNTNIVKPTTGIYAAAAEQAQQQQQQQEAPAVAPQSMDRKQAVLLRQLRATVKRAEQAGKRLQELAQQQEPLKAARPSQEVLSLTTRLQAANAAALEALGALLPAIASDEQPEQEETAGEEAPAPPAAGAGDGGVVSLSVVAEEEEGEEDGEEQQMQEGTDEAAFPAAEAEEATAVVETEGEDAAALVEMVAAVDEQLCALDGEAAVEEAELDHQQQQQEEEEEEEEEEEGVGAGAAGPESPPSMSDLGLSHFTRRFILGAKPSPAAQAGAAATTGGSAAAALAGISPMSASPASPPLPIEKRAAEKAAAAAVGLGTPVITMATAEGGERCFPSPVFRTGVKLKHPPSERKPLAGGSGPTPQSVGTNSSTSSSIPSPALFEPKSADRNGARHSLHNPAPFNGMHAQHHPFLSTSAASKPPPGSVLRGANDASFASSSAPTPALSSPTLRRTRLQQQAAPSQAVRGATAAATAQSDDPTPPLSPSVAALTRGAAAAPMPAIDGGETPSTARCIRLLQFPPSSGGGAKAASAAAAAAGGAGTGSLTCARKSMGRTPLANDMMNESMTHNYPDLTNHSTSFRFSPKTLGLEAEPMDNTAKPTAIASPSTPPLTATAASTAGSIPRYFLRSAEKKALELSAAKAREEQAAAAAAASAVAMPTRRVSGATGVVSAGGSSARKSPRLAARSEALAAADRRVSFSNSGLPTPSPATRKSPRVAAQQQARSGRSAVGRQALFAEEEAAAGVAPMAEVSEAEYAKTPSFIRIQVTREMLNGAIAAMNAHVAQTGAQLEPLERVQEVVAQGDTSKTVLLSLVHLKRVEIVVDARGAKAYKLWK